jgi:hypothetical protein
MPSCPLSLRPQVQTVPSVCYHPILETAAHLDDPHGAIFGSGGAIAGHGGPDARLVEPFQQVSNLFRCAGLSRPSDDGKRWRLLRCEFGAVDVPRGSRVCDSDT